MIVSLSFGPIGAPRRADRSLPPNFSPTSRTYRHNLASAAIPCGASRTSRTSPRPQRLVALVAEVVEDKPEPQHMLPQVRECLLVNVEQLLEPPCNRPPTLA